MLYVKLQAPPPLDATRKFVCSYFDNSEEDFREEVARLAAVNPYSILAGLAGIEALLVDTVGADWASDRQDGPPTSGRRKT